MDIIRAKTAYYPAFHLGSEPQPVECTLAIVEANGKRYLKTPFAMVDAFADDDIERAIDGRGYYATAEECAAYLAAEYPWHHKTGRIMEALLSARHHYGDLVGGGKLADQLGVGVDEVYPLARGHKRFTLKRIKEALARLERQPA